jgi:hypothetical protein
LSRTSPRTSAGSWASWAARRAGTRPRNAWFHRQDRDRTLRDVLAEAERVFGQLLALTQARSEGQLRALYSLAPEGALRPAAESETPAPWPLWKWIANMSLEHYPQHIAPLRAWLDRRGA